MDPTNRDISGLHCNMILHTRTIAGTEADYQSEAEATKDTP